MGSHLQTKRTIVHTLEFIAHAPTQHYSGGEHNQTKKNIYKITQQHGRTVTTDRRRYTNLHGCIFHVE